MENIFGYQTDEIEVKGFINKETILQYVTEEQIFSHILGFEPKEYDYICSPLREDKNPGAFFQRGVHSGRLLFMDFADSFQTCYDCFDFVKRYYGLNSFYDTLKFVKQVIIEGQGITRKAVKKPSAIKQSRKTVQIEIEARPFNDTDGLFWNRYGISRKNLIDDKVFAVNRILLKNSKTGNKNSPVYTKCFAYTDFPDGRKKLYFPYKRGRNRFLTTCRRSDIITRNIDSFKKQLVISKSYKDDRVLRNYGANSIWLQNEGSVPNNLEEITRGFEDVVIFFDNDIPGISAGEKITDIVKSFGIQARQVYLEKALLKEGVKDPSDMYYKKGKKALYKFLGENNIER